MSNATVELPRESGPLSRSRESGNPVTFKRQVRKRDDEDEQDEYYEIDDERPTLEPTDRPTDQRGERPMRTPVTSRWGPKGRNSR